MLSAMSMLKGFRDFILRGNVIDLAVGVVIGASFGAVVNALVKDLLLPLVAAIFTKPDFSSLSFTLNKSAFMYGDFLNALVSFLIVAIAIYFFVVMPLNVLTARMKKPAPAAAPATKKCPECLSDIPKDAKRCAFCTSSQP